VLGYLGISAFAKDENGKSVILSAQEEKLEDKYGEKFLEVFKKDLEDFEKGGSSAETAVTEEVKAQMKADREKDAADLKAARERITALEAEKKTFEETIARLEKTETPDNGEEVKGEREMKTRFKADMSLAHNKYVAARFKGAAYSGDTTVDTEELRKEFGRYVASERIEIINGLFGKTESTQYMSTIMTDKTEVRAQQGAIDSVLQQFVPHWTPKGKSKFTPLKIKNFKCKINVEIIPSDVMEDILGYLYDENLDPKDMPVVKYILNQLIFPKLDEEREIALAVGEYKESKATKDGDDATEANEVMDGYVTLLRRFREDPKKYPITLLLDGVTLEDAKLVDQIDKAVDQVAALYKKKKMFIHADPDLVTRYGKAYRAKYPWLKNEDGEKIKVDFSKFTFAPLEGMRGTGVFFITPKENFKHLASKNPQQTKLRMATMHYSAYVYAEWWEGVGFWIAEAVFAYFPPEKGEAKASAADPGEQGL
jgi:hypothetical protein